MAWAGKSSRMIVSPGKVEISQLPCIGHCGLADQEAGGAELMWSFLRRVGPSIFCLVVLVALNRFFPAEDVVKSWWWTLVLPNVMVAFISYREANRAKADHNVVMRAISERLRSGRLTEPERRLALRFYDQLRDDLSTAVIRGGSFHAGESLHLALQHGVEEVLTVLPKLRKMPWDVPELTPDEEKLLAGLAADSQQYAKAVVQWLFASGSDIEGMQQDGLLRVDDSTVCRYLLDWLPELSGDKYSDAVSYLKTRKQHIKGRTDALRELQRRLLRCDGQDFDDTVEVIGGINCGEGQETLQVGIKKLLRLEKEKQGEKRKKVDRQMAELITVAGTC